MRDCDVTVQKIKYHNRDTGYAVFEGMVLRWSKRKQEYLPTRETHVFVGYFFCLYLGDHLQVSVMESFHKVHGSQYAVIFGRRIEPSTTIEIRSFLLKNIKGMTAKRVDRLMAVYGASVLDAVKKDPHAIDFLGLAPDATRELHEDLLRNAQFEDLVAFLQREKIDCRLAMPLFDKYGVNAEFFIRDNPYQPYLDGIFDFRTADRLYLEKEILPNDKTRCLYSTFAALKMDSKDTGNVFTRKSALRKKLMSFLTETSGGGKEGDFPFSDEDISTAVASLEDLGFVIVDGSYQEGAIYLRENYFDERDVARYIENFMKTPKNYEYPDASIRDFLRRYEIFTSVKLADKQRDAVFTALTSPITVITGGPGTGKTQTINAIMAAVKDLTPGAVIRSCAPTGKASIRVSELTGMPSSTIHRMIGLGNFKGLKRDGELICDVLFVDEFSMCDIHLCAKLLCAVCPTARIIIVGDYNQLPSVGPGLVLRDLITSRRIPTVMLDKVFRQAGNSNIVLNAHRIINQKPGESITLRISNKPDKDFYFIEEPDPSRIERILIQSVERLASLYHLGQEAVQLLSPVHGGGLGVDRLNFLLQQRLNPTPIVYEFGDKEFRLGDKVIHTNNNYDLGVFNGEVGYITDISFTSKDVLTVTYPDRDIRYTVGELNQLELAYALTIHKMQGSEQPVILLPIHESFGPGLNKNSIYTALTRAKRMVILVGSSKALSDGMRRETIIERESNLVSRIRESLPELG